MRRSKRYKNDLFKVGIFICLFVYSQVKIEFQLFDVIQFDLFLFAEYGER